MSQAMYETVSRYIKDHFLSPASPELTADTPLFSTGMIDSFGVLELITFLEDTYHIAIDTARHEIREFDSIAKIMGLVQRIQADGP
jgi:acyl carrier protein